jgi:tRNA pseudouridine38-40 synthase
MAVYKMIVAYKGTAYYGWQRQPDVVTVVSMLEQCFLSVFKQKISISGASRTDAGVHALGQVASFALDTQIAPESLLFAWNNALPADIVIKALSYVPDSFNPRHNVVQKTYHYLVFLEQPMPLFEHCGWYYSRDVDIDLLYQALQVFVGTHDFRSFCTGYDMESTIRRIDSIDLEFDAYLQGYKIIIKGPGFLRYMIRRIVGACLAVASKKQFVVQDLIQALEDKNPAQILPNSPAKGLLLYEIKYQNEGC